MPAFRPLADRLWEKVDKTGPIPPHRPDHLAYIGHPDLVLDNCWLWTASTISGYGQINLGRGSGVGLAHRVAWELENGPIPDRLHLDHLCLVTRCVRPTHVEPVTIAENSRRQAWITERVCRNGHDRTPANTYIRPDNGRRVCMVCHTLHRSHARAAS